MSELLPRIKTPQRPGYSLTEYPHAIAQAQTYIANLDLTIAETKAEITVVELAIDKQVAFDTELKNEGQRKSKRKELIAQDDGHDLLTGKLETDKRAKARAEIRLTLLINQFTVAKIEARGETARQLAIAA